MKLLCELVLLGFSSRSRVRNGLRPILLRVSGFLFWSLLWRNQSVLVLLYLAGLASLAAFIASLLRAVTAAATAPGLRADTETQVLGALLWRFERLPFAHVSRL